MHAPLLLRKFGSFFAMVAVVSFFYFHRKWLLVLAGFLILLISYTVRGADDQEVGSSEIPEVALNVNGIHPLGLVAIKGGRDLYERDETKTSKIETTNRLNRPTSQAHSRVFSNWQTAQTVTFNADDNNRIDRDHLVTAAFPPNGGGVGVGAAEYVGLDFGGFPKYSETGIRFVINFSRSGLTG